MLIDRAGIDIVAGDAGRNLTYLKEAGARERFCRGPEPDFSRTAGSGMSGGLPTLGGGALVVGNSASKGALDLGGRDPAVLLARELFYRACELASNTNADPATEREIYDKFLGAIVDIAKSHAGSGSAPLASEPAPPPPVTVVPNRPASRGPGADQRYPSEYTPIDPPDPNKDQ